VSSKKGDWLRMVPMLLWFLLVSFGVVFLALYSPHDSRNPIATRDLPRNTLLAGGDVAQPGLTDRYVVAPQGIKSGAAILPQDLGNEPVPIAAPPTQLFLSLPVGDSPPLNGINAAVQLQLCGASTPALTQVTVQFVSCLAKNATASCSATVALPLDALGELANRGMKDRAAVNALHLAKSCT
jgi:hypothetical protein